ncbi:hypothetical protein [Devosia sp.]|uniref:hypothetical protein n=1 Tax=Devosia sp. TaxID=1871048 RepID=UPI002733966A|nr:hypothetical protein [Devosia sp.]MDP2779841.1 hypothetical protein [Devosia sp.]
MSLFSKVKPNLNAIHDASRALVSGVELLRRQIQELREQRRTTSLAPVDEAEARRRLDSWVSDMRGQVLEQLSPAMFTAPDYQPRTPPANSPITTSAIAVLLGEMYSELIARQYSQVSGITDDERKAALRQIDADILDAEMTEESIIRNAEQAGISIMRRRDADPRAVLAFDADLP